jgi:hypothetical protein
MSQALLAVYMNPPADDLKAWNAWYDDEHVPARLRTPGILSGQRYTAVRDDGPRYVAVYDLESLDVLQTAAYKQLGAQRSELEKRMLANTPMVDRRVLRTVQGAPPLERQVPLLLTVGLEPPAGGEDDLRAWYAQEHIPMLLNVPGWRRIRLFEQVDGTGTRFLALHELESEAVFDTAEYKQATSTPWRERVISGVTRRERWLFSRYTG